ncbi:glycosyltransferase family 4 protein [Methylobacterium soli]|uniref:Glycosyltransferase family 4 protein n=1 Tax=Methylobacterium soli TaxID=553447 RepID=A0A6L3T4J3_9HYPH|nr:glycosyltransferase family 4 protein [Methylobacterium soli]KAB1080959.1 glycosyltransferase family 4 protein [Methylobacterium soli]GJE41174.1 D-inositol-3-phosphate glycosyltransferase [Methylobacterium soli]
MTRITCVHQGFELYGSDRSFIETVRVIRAAWPAAWIDVVLPRSGPIVAPLEAIASRVLIEPLWILRRRELPRLATIGLLTLPFAVGRALRRIRSSDLVYVNTSVVADYLLAARAGGGRSIVHVHEIPEGAVLKALRALIRWSGCGVIFNSRATERAFAMPAHMRARVVYNGIADPGPVKAMTYDGSRPLRLLMLGRISRIKGQDVLVEAIGRLPGAIRDRIEVRIVGGAFADAEREQALVAAIAEAGLAERVTLHPFVADPAPHFLWADVVAVPSCLPESLGRVAIEAMAYGIPPIVSDIGGLPEVVEHGSGGWVVPPGRADRLAEALTAIVARPESWRAFPAAARLRYQTVFGEAASAEAMRDQLLRVLGRRASGTAPGT